MEVPKPYKKKKSFWVLIVTELFCDILRQPLFAFLYKEQFPVDGWKVYDPVAEYRRQVTAHQL